MSNYYESPKEYYEEPKTTSSTQQESKPDVKKIVASFQEDINSSLYITRRPRARVIGNVKKQDKPLL
jgi:hypothetical protein